MAFRLAQGKLSGGRGFWGVVALALLLAGAVAVAWPRADGDSARRAEARGIEGYESAGLKAGPNDDAFSPALQGGDMFTPEALGIEPTDAERLGGLSLPLATISADTVWTAAQSPYISNYGVAAASEITHGLGAIPSPPEVLERASRDYANRLLALAQTTALPTSVDLSGQLPPIGDQGFQGSCTAWAVAYYYKTFQERAEHGWDVTTPLHYFSPSYVYNQLHANDPACGGTSISAAIDLIISQGVAPWSVFPYSDAAYHNNDCQTQPNDFQRRVAQPFRAQSKQILFWHYGYFTDYNIVTILKAHLALGDILVINYPVCGSTACGSSPYVNTPCQYSQNNAHAVAIVGYDDTTGYFKFANSWSSCWGDNGYGYMSYSFVATYPREAWAMVDQLGDFPSVPYPPLPYGTDIASVRDAAGGGLETSTALYETKELNFGYVQVYVKWADVEPAKGWYEWAALDDILRQCDYYQLKPVVRIYRAPSWARPPGSEETAPPTNPQDLRDFMNALVGRYGTRFAGYVIWNEPNLPGEWGGQAPNAITYTALLQAAYNGAKAANPSATIASAGLAPTNGGSGAISDLAFLQQMYDAGLRNSSDVVGMNGLGFGYSPDDTSDPGGLNFSRLASLRNVMVANGDGAKSAWALEVGWLRESSVDLGGYNWMKVTALQQANYLKRALLKARSEWPWLTLSFVWNLDFNRYYGSADQRYWFAIDGTQAYDALLELQSLGTVIGRVDLQGRADDGGATVALAGTAYSATTTTSGVFTLTDVASGAYTATASMSGYLYARRAFTIGAAGGIPLTAVTLLGGDADHDGDIDIYDLTTLGASFGAAGGAADINGDGAVNIFDLAMVGANFGRSAPLPWP